MNPFSFTISGIAYQLDELPVADRSLLESAKAMTTNAYAPYSQFNVGAALRLANGKVVEGSNQENAAYPSGLCAERVAIFAASSQYPEITVEAMAIAVSTKKFDVNEPLSPCGGCRQVLMEYRHRQKSPMRIILAGTGNIVWIFEDVSALLPFSFNADGLKG